MSIWKSYRRFDFPEDPLPWEPASALPVMPNSILKIGKESGKMFDPASSYFARLSIPWGEHPVGSRVILTPTVIAIEIPDPALSHA